MNNILSEYIEKFQKHHKDYKRYLLILALLAFATFIVVNWQLHQTGISMTADYQCGYKEHTHTDDCYEKVLVCGKEETDGSEGHTHSDKCYEEQKVLNCSKEEHSHESSCYDDEGNLICGKEEHTHTDDCYTIKKVLICGKEESPKVEAHHHTDKCYEKKLTCKIPEHVHTVECLSNEKADVETDSDWEKTLPSLTEDTRANIIAVAKSQIGYTESTKNFKLADDGKTKKGYTRYGDWYGDKYGDWSAMFASFVYHYAGISKETVPVNSGAYAWTVELKKANLYKKAGDYSPTAGDLIFFDTDKDSKSDQVGIVEKVTDAKITTIEGDSSDKVKENSYKINDETIIGYGFIPTEETSEATTSAAKKAKAKAATRAATTGITLNDYVTSGTFEKKNGNIWEVSDSFTTSDQVRATINFENIPTADIKNNGNTGRLQLPEGFDCSKFVGQTFDTRDGNTTSGTYTFEKGSDGHWYIVLKLKDDYVENAGEKIGGSLQLQFQWNKDSGSEEGKKETISIGKWDATVTIKKDQTDKPEETGNHFGLAKTGNKLSYSEDGKTGYIEYTVTLTINKAVTGPIELTDKLTGNNWAYDNILSSNIDANWTINDKEAKISAGKAGETIQPGTYTITYRIKNDKISELTASDSNSVYNAISAKDDDKTINANKWTNTTVSKINKQGKLIEGDGNTYIDYTVYLNAGDIIKDLKEGATFTDTIPNDVKLVGDVTVNRYDVTGKLVDSTTAKVDGQNISYTTPTGQYYYEIHYRTTAKDPNSLPIGGLEVKNTAHADGDIKGDSSSTVTIPNHVLTKTFKEQTLTQDKNIMKWESKIDIEGSLKGYVYEDWFSTWAISMTMSEEQRTAIKVIDGNGNTVSADKYKVTTSDMTENGKSIGLFKITFEDVTGPVILQYETTADLSKITNAGWINFSNNASITKDGHTDKASADTGFYYKPSDSRDIIYKYGQNYAGDRPSSSSITLKPGETSIPWTILLNQGQNLTGDLVVTDEISADLTFVKDSLKVAIQNKWQGDITNKVDWNYDESTRVLKIKIPKDCYTKSEVIVISYRTELPESFYSGTGETGKFKNSASVEQNGSKTDSTFEQEVTRQVIGKSGRYDKKDQTLTYEIVVNPDASRLNGGNTLTITDTFDSKGLDIKLKGLAVFTSLKTTDSNGNTTVQPGTLVKRLTPSDEKKEFTYQWDEKKETFTTYLPDSTAYVIVAEYYIESELAEDVTLSNSVEIKGEQSWSAKDDSTKAEHDTSGQTYTNKDSIAITKHDSAQYNNLLNGAEFKLEEYNNNSWGTPTSTDTIKVSSTLTTGSGSDTGKAYTAVKRNVLYRLTETKAPDKYIMDDTPHYFIVVTEGTTPSLPDSISGDATYSKDKVNIYTVTNGPKDFANIVIDRYNAKDTTYVEPGQLRVNKVWIGGDGNQVTDPTALAKMKDVKVTLTKKAPETFTINFKGSQDTSEQMQVPKGSTIIIKSHGINSISHEGNATYKYEAGNAESNWVPWYYFSNIQSDLIINVGAYLGNWLVGTVTIDTTNASTETKSTIISTETLNPTNDWSHLWTDLETGEGIQYILTEETVDGYKTTYTLDSKELTVGNAFSLGDKGSKVTVTNTADQEYVLPETGGMGTLPFTVGGIAIIALALICGYSLRRKR